MKSLLVLCALLSLTLVYSSPVTTEFTVDGNTDDWDSARVSPVLTKGTSFNNINMQSTGLHAFACAEQITHCYTGFPWKGRLRTLSPFESTVSLVSNLISPVNSSTGPSIGDCPVPQRNVAKLAKTFIFPAVISQAGNLRVTTVAAHPTKYLSHTVTAIENLPSVKAFTLTFASTFPAVPLTSWIPIPTAISTGLPTCEQALPFRRYSCPSGIFYFKKSGIVFLSGLFLASDPASATSTRAVFATLPADARPQYDNDYVVTCDTTKIGYVTVKTTGEITFTGRASKYCSLDGLSYLFAREIPAGAGKSPFSHQFGSLFRAPSDNSRSPIVALTEQFGIQFLTPFQNGHGLLLASFTATSGSCDSEVEIHFPVMIDSQLAFARSVARGRTLSFYLSSASFLSTIPPDFRRAFAAHNPTTGYFGLLLEGFDASNLLFVITFTFTNSQNAIQALAVYTPLTKSFIVQQGSASIGATASAYTAPFFELALSEPNLVKTGNKVTIAFAGESFSYSF